MGREVPETRFRGTGGGTEGGGKAAQSRDERVKAANQEEAKVRGRRKAVLQPYPVTSAWLNELRARAADSTTEGRTAFRYRKTFGKDADDEEDDVDGLDGFEKEDGDDVDEDTPARAQTLHRKRRLAVAYFEELDEEEQAHMQAEREKDFVDRRNAYERALKGETECSTEELADSSVYASRRRHAEVVSQRALQSLCAQMKCKGILVLGEIVDGEEEEIFISMVQEGALPGHPDIDFSAWTPLRSKGLLQSFADFLVACKKAEMGEAPRYRFRGDTSASSSNPAGAPANTPDTPALCAQCMGPLIPLQRPASNVPAADPAPNAVEDSLPKVRVQRGGGHKRGRKEPGEREAEDSGSRRRRMNGRAVARMLSATNDPFADDEDEDQGDQGDQGGTPPPPPSLRYPPNAPLQRALDANGYAPAEYEFDRERNIARNQESSAPWSRRTPVPRRGGAPEPTRAGLDSGPPCPMSTANMPRRQCETAHDARRDTGAVGRRLRARWVVMRAADEHAAIDTSALPPPTPDVPHAPTRPAQPPRRRPHNGLERIVPRPRFRRKSFIRKSTA
ncbi:hypothetical protein DFH08DRAFT_820694 [Mycena albidolilacea]|uniref:Uncharacterized protein n=1 Tax=Mycena albidolilacea TaxID=1033008 RepID=A0AAD6ZCG5_9AGAR|nr:hypothetical protein DFH08DRAFT_820694 [Mycena albidolilacea]